MRKGFTLIELLVAMAVLALMIAFASMVFSVSIDTYRVSMATAEIMQKLRVVTDQLDLDFKGLRSDAPVLIWFEQKSSSDPNRRDEIMFFADGDFSSIQLYTLGLNSGHPDPVNGDTVIRGNTARVFYGQTNLSAIERKRILARRQHILTSDTNVDDWPNAGAMNFNEPGEKNEWYEHDRLSLAEWKNVAAAQWNTVRSVCFQRPQINTSDDYHKLLCDGLSSYAIQWAYWDPSDNRFYWYPDSARLADKGGSFGVYFNVGSITGWDSIGSIGQQYRENNAEFFPQALKFTFKLYDSKGIIKGGMEFSHIVYLEQ